MKIGRLLLRATVGGFFIGHGTQKLFGWFGGQGLKKQAKHFEGMGLEPGIVHASAAGAAETLGGAGLLLGYRTPLAAASLISVMFTAISRVHLKNGPWGHRGGYEYNAVLIAAAASLAESGPGGLSLDAVRGKEQSGALWALFSIVGGAAGAAGAHLFAESRAARAVVGPDASPPVGSSDDTGLVDAARGQQPSDGSPVDEADADDAVQVSELHQG